MDTFNSDGVQIAYRDEGPQSASAAVMLIHGFASNTATNWVATGWMRDLADAG